MSRRATLLALLLVTVTVAGCTQELRRLDGSSAGTFIVHMKDLVYDPLVLEVPPGATVRWVNEDPFGHTVSPVDPVQWGGPGSGDDAADWMMQGETYEHTFESEGTYLYYCLPHANLVDGEWKGMVAQVVVTEDADPVGASGSDSDEPGPPQSIDVEEIGRMASDVPPPIGNRGPTDLAFNITVREVVAEMNEGTTYPYWTFDGTVPGPMLRVREGDQVTINLHNEDANFMGHDIDFHAVNGPGGGAPMLATLPGETTTFSFQALNPGLYVYHCAFQDPPVHIAHGMYGLILVEPAGGLPLVDKEFYVVQGDFYSPFNADQAGHHPYDGDRAMRENPTFVVFNGRMASLKDEARQLQADVGDTVRLFVGNGGPNLVSSFHVIGEIFDRAWDQAAILSEPQRNVQTTLVPAGGAAMVEFELDTAGDYFLVDHSIYRVHKGAFGVLHASGEDNEEVYRSGP